MYDLVDRPVADLPRFERDTLDAMRRWVHALVLAGPSAAAGGTPFGGVMRLLDTHSADDLAIARPCAPAVAEDEAVLLGLWRLVRDRRDAPAHATAALLVGADQAAAVVTAMRPLAQG
jgi:hypothetical protein